MLTLLTSGIAISTVFLALLAVKKSLKPQDYVLIVWFVCFMAHMGILLARWNDKDSTLIYILANTLSLFYGPFLLMFTHYVFSGKIARNVWYHVAIPILVLFFGLAFGELLPYPFAFTMVPVKVLSYVLYPLIVIQMVNKNLKAMKMERADDFVSQVIWIKGVAIILLISVGMALLLLLVTSSLEIDSQFFDRVRFVVMIFIVGIYGVKQGVIYKPDEYTAPNQIHPESRYGNSPLQPQDRKQFVQKLTWFFENQETFLHSEFSLGTLSNQLEIPKHHLSQVINTELKTTFYELVNFHRTNHAARRISDPKNKHLTLEAIGYSCGYNSKSAFFGHFKKHHGMTPRQYLLERSS